MTFYEVIVTGEDFSAICTGLDNLLVVTDHLDMQAKAGELGEGVLSVSTYDKVKVCGSQLSKVLALVRGDIEVLSTDGQYRKSEPSQIAEAIDPNLEFEIYLSEV
jgi:hypothetical protein